MREVEVRLATDEWPILGSQGIVILDSISAPIYETDFPYVFPNITDHLSTRQVLNPDDYIAVSTGAQGWSWRISGYVLTLP